MENSRLERRATNSYGDVENVIDDLIKEVEEWEAKCAELEIQITKLQEELNEFKTNT